MSDPIVEHQLVVLISDLPDEGLMAGDVGVVLLRHEGIANVPSGYTIEVTTLLGETVAIVDVEHGMVRAADPHDVRHVRSVAVSA
jgi:hypothetical protein